MGDNNTPHLEIERKFLIEYPDEAALASIPGARRYEIEQVYLPREGERIRRRRGDGGAEFFHTVKKPLTALTRHEDEREIGEGEYAALLASAGGRPAQIDKVRWRLPHGGLVVEVDIYPFWRRVAVAEIELESEEAAFSFPDCIGVLREVTRDKSYSNHSLAEALRGGRISEPEL